MLNKILKEILHLEEMPSLNIVFLSLAFPFEFALVVFEEAATFSIRCFWAVAASAFSTIADDAEIDDRGDYRSDADENKRIDPVHANIHPIRPTIVAKVQAIPVWKSIALSISLVEPSSLRIAAIAAKQGALKRLKIM